jgi:hypothetical protein
MAIADMTNRIRKIHNGYVTTLAGGGKHGYAEGDGTAALFADPSDVAVDANGFVYVADQNNHRYIPHHCPILQSFIHIINMTMNMQNSIRKISPSGSVTTMAGQGGRPGLGKGAFGEGNADRALFSQPYGLALDRDGHGTHIHFHSFVVFVD